MRISIAAAVLAVTAGAAAAYPDRPITIVVPFAAGGPTDETVRHLAEALRRGLNNQNIIIENVGGAGGTLGAARVAKALPDGYTLLVHSSSIATSPALYRRLPYRTLDDFEYLGMIAEVPMTLIGRPGLPAASFAELRAWIDANKGRINFANSGVGSASWQCGLLLQQALGVAMTTVPYKGTAPAMTDLLGGQIDLMCDQTTSTTAQIESGKVRAYAVTTRRRLGTPALAALPTLDESGLTGFDVTAWQALYAPRGTPQAVLDTIAAALKQALADAAFIRHEETLGAIVIADGRVNGAEHKKFVEAEIAKWGPLIAAAGQYAD
jgi:tripartite-type tricarboxylate transporter receptor subunit TctC